MHEVAKLRFHRQTRVSVAFPTIDLRIPRLSDFIGEVASSLAASRPLSASVRAAARLHPAAREAFELDCTDAELDEGFTLKPELTFPDEDLPRAIAFERGGRVVHRTLDPFSARDLRALFERIGAGGTTLSQLTRELDEPMLSLLNELHAEDMVVESPETRPYLSTPPAPGITRLQHAGLLYRGHDAAILVDPHFNSAYEPEGLVGAFVRGDFAGGASAIVISHGHHDHFHLPTLMSFPVDTPIVVPRLPRGSLLCPPFSATLRAFGFRNVIELGWDEPALRFGDLGLHALPFYGEQPLRDEPTRHPDLRNVGNTYVVRHASYSSWFLIDSGADFRGNMAEVAERVRARFGPIDALASNLREFSMKNPMYITGAGHYWLALSPDQMRRFASMSDHRLTLGPSGVAQVARICEARAFLPYAHWWAPLGGISDLEPALVAALEAELSARGSRTRVVPWRVGDAWTPRASSSRSP